MESKVLTLVRGSSVSTMWTVGRFPTMLDFVKTARGLGFERIEVNYEVSPAQLEEITHLYETGQVHVSSVHDPVLVPEGLTLRRLPQLSSLDAEERGRAVDFSLRALDIARSLGAKAMVMHAGRVDGLRQMDLAVRKALTDQESGAGDIDELRAQLMYARAKARGPYLEALAESLRILGARASELDIKLGLESRYYYDEMPLVEEAVDLIAELRHLGVGYWHDIGHAQVLAQLGYVPADAWLETLGGDLVGFHLHDSVGVKDHNVPGSGTIDFAKARPYTANGALRVCEFGRWNSESEARRGLEYLVDAGFYEGDGDAII